MLGVIPFYGALALVYVPLTALFGWRLKRYLGYSIELQRARVLANHALAQTELAHVERADHPDFTKPLASARVRADLVDHVAAELAKRRGEREVRGARGARRVGGGRRGDRARVDERDERRRRRR